MLNVRILGTGSALPARVVTTESVAAAIGRDADHLRQRTGIDERRWLDPGARVSDLAADALRAALDRAGLPATALRRVIFVTSCGGDDLFPANANRVLDALGIEGGCDAFDLNNACLGFVSGLDLAARCVATGLGPVGVVAIDNPSWYIEPSNPRPYAVFGDAAAAAVIGQGAADEGVVGVHLANVGGARGTARLSNVVPGCPAPMIEFEASSAALTALATQLIRDASAAVLAAAGLSLDEVRWVAPHQPNGAMLDVIVEALGVPPEKLVRVVDRIGSVGAASIGVGLDRIMRERPVAAGDHILLVGVGAGVSSGALLYRVGA
jgi:3-oxoacyl-[acyl-carrier-protein] synthase-3